MSKIALCVGLNNYPNPASSLKGCVNDATRWASLLQNKYRFDKVVTLFDSQATFKSVTSLIASLSKEAEDCFVFTNSSHGTSVINTNGTEIDGRDEAICLYDALLLDDVLRQLLNQTTVNKVVISDSCHSGTIGRSSMMNTYMFDTLPADCYQIARYMPPEQVQVSMDLNSIPVLRSFVDSDNCGDNDIILSGCEDSEYSYDAYFNGIYQGAMSYMACNILENDNGMTYNDFYDELRACLPSKYYPQSPRLSGKSHMLQRRMFA